MKTQTKKLKSCFFKYIVSENFGLPESVIKFWPQIFSNRSSKMAQQLKMLSVKLYDLWSQEFTRGKARTDFHKMPFNLHIDAMACVLYIIKHYSIKINQKNKTCKLESLQR